MLLLNINKKPYMGSPMTLSHLTLIGPYQGHSDIKGLYLVNQLGHMLHQYVTPIGNPIWGVQKLPSHLSLSDLQRSKIRCCL